MSREIRDSDGLFLGRDAFLERDESGTFAARPVAELQKILRRAYGDDKNWEGHSRSTELVARALNKGDMARAMMTAVLMRLPDPGDPGGNADADGALAKAGFNPDEPRDSQGRWTAGGDGANEPGRDPRTQLADAGASDASNDAVAQAAERAEANAARRHQATSAPQTNNWLAHYKKLWEAIALYFYGEAQNATRKEGDQHKLASRILQRMLGKRSDIQEDYLNSKLRTISKGDIDSGIQPDNAVITNKNVIEPYEVKSPSNTYKQLLGKYENIRPIEGSKFTLARVKIFTIKELLATPEAKEIAEEDARAKAALERQKAIEEEELFEQMKEEVIEDTDGEE